MRASSMEATSVFAPSIPEVLFMFYQMTFAIITVALVAGSIADRMRFSAFAWFAAGWLIFVYVPIAHWVWGGGFLARAGVLDFAGGTGVHINAGVAGLVPAFVRVQRRLGARRQLARGLCNRGNASCGIDWRADLDVPGMVDAGQTIGSGHDFRGCRWPRDHHSGIRFHFAMGGHRDRVHSGGRLLLGLHVAQAAPWL